MAAVRPIDRFVSAMHRQNAEELLLETGRPGRIRSGGAEKVVLAQDVRTDQIELLIREVLPPDCQRSFQLEGEIGFPYNAPTGPVLIRARRSRDRIAVSIRPYPVPQATSSSSPPPRTVVGARTAPSTPARHAVALPVRVAVEQVRVAAPPPPPVHEVLPAYDPKEINLGNISSGDTGPIELDLSTGSLPLLSTVELRQLDSQDIVGPVIPGVSLHRDDVVTGRAQPAPVVPAMAAAPIMSHVAHAPIAATTPAPAVVPAPAPVAQANNARKTKGRIDAILTTLVRAGASDLHLTAGLVPRMRKDGDMCPVPGFEDALSSDTIEQWLMEIAPDKSRAKFQATNDADYGYEIAGLARFRANAFRDRRGVGGVFRVIPAAVLTADQLNLPKAVRELTTLHKGLVVVTGPTGSGKSTTLAAMIDLANKTRADHIITIEDPVEFVHVPDRCLINQREVHSDTESFSSGLRAALREDPDIVLVGEMRDLETIAIAVETAETGHLVFGTLHTTTAVSTVDRIVDQFPADRQQQIRVMLSSALKGVVAQTLCKKIGGGRVAALEILLGLPAVANLIREGKTFQIASVMQTGKAIGMQTLNDALFQLVQDGVVAAEEALAKAVARLELRALLERANLMPK